jgi:L-ascorbate metabolism protein UlaG (beta-lactamase superfamily)
MNIRRLGWAGLELESDGTSLVIDHLLDPGSFSAFFHADCEPLVTPARHGAQAALVTHLHRDHTDVDAIQHALGEGAAVYRPRPSRRPTDLDVILTGEGEAGLTASGRTLHECDPADTHRIGPFTVTALPASDAFGSPQVSWLVEADGQRILHGGDTLWHGSWWNIARQHGPIDIACLPANGAKIAFPLWQPAADVESVMTPAQAVEAARALRAHTLVPIHHQRSFEHEVFYRPLHNTEALISAHAARAAVVPQFLDPGVWSSVADLTAERVA